MEVVALLRVAGDFAVDGLDRLAEGAVSMTSVDLLTRAAGGR
jgi:hypothetical protein